MSDTNTTAYTEVCFWHDRTSVFSVSAQTYHFIQANKRKRKVLGIRTQNKHIQRFLGLVALVVQTSITVESRSIVF